MLCFRFDGTLGWGYSTPRETVLRLGALIEVALVSRDPIVVLLPSVKFEVEFPALEDTLEEDVIGGGGNRVIVVALPERLLNALSVPYQGSGLGILCRVSFFMGDFKSRLGAMPEADLGRL